MTTMLSPVTSSATARKASALSLSSGTPFTYAKLSISQLQQQRRQEGYHQQNSETVLRVHKQFTTTTSLCKEVRLPAKCLPENSLDTHLALPTLGLSVPLYSLTIHWLIFDAVDSPKHTWCFAHSQITSAAWALMEIAISKTRRMPVEQCKNTAMTHII